MDVRSAELTKYAANAMLATRISFMNELARLAEVRGGRHRTGAPGIGSDPRIGTHFLYAGTGYGGSCFPKDVKALVRTGDDTGIELRVLARWRRPTSPEAGAGRQGRRPLRRDLQGRRFALWGLAFKPDTDDMREAPSRVIVHELLRRGAAIQAYDPVAMDEARRVFGDLPGLSFRQPPGGRAARCRCAADRHRVARVQEPGLRADAGAAQAAADLRRPQPLRFARRVRKTSALPSAGSSALADRFAAVLTLASFVLQGLS
jgi:UDP-glucose 6-dehydrogenase